MSHKGEYIALDQGDAKFMALMSRFSERLDWMKGDAEQRNRQLELQRATLGSLEKGMSKMEGMIGAMRDELRATAALNLRVVDIEKRATRLEDTFVALNDRVETLDEFKDGIMNKLALIGLIAFLGGGGISMLAIRILTGGNI